MPGSLDTQAAPDLPDERRLALIVATESYEDASLHRLRAPAHDAVDLREVLADPEVGGFEVTPVIDGTAHEVRIAVGDFLADRGPDDLVLVVLSCHGLVDLRRRLYFAARDTAKSRLAATGVGAQWLLEQLEDCRARRQVLVLDCCFSGAFATGAKGDEDLEIGKRFHGQGRGRVVLTASRDSEYSFEGEPVPGQAVPGSVFTSALVAGIRSGAADLDQDGYISVDDAYGYAFDAVRASNAEQTPQRWFYGAEGTILLARSPAGVTITPAQVPDGISSSLDSSYPSVRIGAVEALAEWLNDDDPARVVAARRTLTHVVESDRPEVAARARALLDIHAERGATTAGVVPPPSPAVAAGAGATAAEATVHTSTRKRWYAVPRAWYAVPAVLILVGVVVATVLWSRQPSDPGTGGLGEGGGGTYTASEPWRLEIHDKIEEEDNGCSVTMTQDGSDLSWQQEGIYDSKVFQLPYTGTFRWTVSDPGCVIVPRATPGQLELPFTWAAYKGDTAAFSVSGAFTAENLGGDECELVLNDPSDGTTVDIRTATKTAPSVTLDPSGRSEVYLVDPSCNVRVSE